MSNRTRAATRTLAGFAAGLALVLTTSACESNGATESGTPVVLQISGVVESDALGEALRAPVLVRVFRPDGRGGWSQAEPDAEGRYTMEIELRDGCEAGATLEAAASIRAPDHRELAEDLGSGRPVACDPEPQTLDYVLFREVFRTPVPVAGDLRASVVSSYALRCAVTDQGTYCWGTGDPVPVAVPGGDDFQLVEVGGQHACALDGEGAAWCWGSNQNGVLGVQGMEASPIPIPVETNLRFRALAANFESTCGLEDDGQVHCWGLYGGATPEPFGGTLRFEQIRGQYAHMCGVESGSGAVHCWGSNSRGEVGREETGRAQAPVQVPGLPPAASVATGVMFSCALTEEGDAHCWGWNCDRQLGAFGSAQTAVPVAIDGAPPLTAMSLGLGYSCGLTEDGEVWCWGLNHRGQLGAETGSLTVADPVRVSGEVPFTSISAGFRSACGVGPEGKVYCWGDRQGLGAGLPLAAAGEAPWTASPPAALPVRAGASCGGA